MSDGAYGSIDIASIVAISKYVILSILAQLRVAFAGRTLGYLHALQWDNLPLGR